MTPPFNEGRLYPGGKEGRRIDVCKAKFLKSVELEQDCFVLPSLALVWAIIDVLDAVHCTAVL